MNATIDIPAGGPFFAGHFPGRPILPAVTLLALVTNTETLRAVGFLRLRQLIAPGDRLLLDRREIAGGARIALRRDGALVANGELVYGEPRADVMRAGADISATSDSPPLDTLLPHRLPMRFVTGVLREDEDGATCAARIPDNCALVSAGSAPAFAAIEAAAQTAAVWEALRRCRGGGGGEPAARLGYLVALRDIVLCVGRIPANETLIASVRLTAAAPPLTHYAVDVSLGTMRVLRGTVATFLTEEIIS